MSEVHHSEGGPECAFETGLAHAAGELGSQTTAVLMLESDVLEVVYHRGESGGVRAATAVPCSVQMQDALVRGPGLAPVESMVARFLKAAVAPVANAFLLFPWRARGRDVIIVFGFAERQPGHASIPAHVVGSLNLAALAAWSLREVDRLRAELRAMNDRFAGRKLVERAKCVLQSERGMDEQQAYEYLRKLSRQRRITLAKMAEGLLATSRCP